jgi:carboxyl-terminal processing protease
MLTIAKYQSPSGKKIEDVAVTPNVAVSQSIEEAAAENENNPQEPRTDDQLNKALQLLKQKNA